MSPEERVQQALKALADHDRALESPRPAPRLHRLRPVSRWETRLGYGAAIAAAAAALVLYLQPSPEQPAKLEPPPKIEVSAAPPPVAPVKVAVAPKPVRRAAKRPAPPAVEEPREVVTEFFPLMEAPPPFERGQLLRVMVPAATLQTVGLPVNPDRWSQRIPADILVGEEGMPRAIRFVSYQQ